MSYIALVHVTLDNSEVGLCSVYIYEIWPAQVSYLLSYVSYRNFYYGYGCISTKIMDTDIYLYIL